MQNLVIKVYGKVQGVFFRVSTKEFAEKLGLFGWVKNEEDGTVAIEIEGEKEKLDEFLELIKQGPSGSTVDKLDKKFSKQLKNYQFFEIKY